MNYQTVDSNTSTAVLRRYVEICEENKYEDMILPGFWNFPAGKDIPEDLLMPIGEWVKKHKIEPLLARISRETGGGVAARGDFASTLTLYIVQAYAPPIARAFLGDLQGFAPVNNNMELYNKIAALLGSDVLFESTVVESSRNESGVQLVVQGKQGTKKLIIAKQLLLSIQPTRENLAPFDLSAWEKELFSKPKYARSHMSIATHSKLPNGTALVNLNASAAEHPLTAFIDPPYVTRFEHYGSPTKLFRVPIAGQDFNAFDVAAAQKIARSSLERMSAQGTVPPLQGEELKFLQWSDHAAVGYGVSAEDLRNNWIHDLYSLQGKRSTWFTGGVVATDFTTTLWEFNEGLFPKMLQNL
jgi:hypothetical protein